MPLNIGDRLGPYEVTGELGAGGMGIVLRARDTKLDRDVALKVLPEAFTTDPDRLARFGREAKVLASLNHPNIGSIYGLEEAEGVKALVLELVEGPTLAERIKQGPIPIDEALPIAKRIAEALEAAHEQGVIHRDLKPANIKVREDGTVKVLDFGLAKALEGDLQHADLSQSPTVTSAGTREGVILGTAAYMSPEQARGKPLDKRTDIWSFGCVLFEMLTGRLVFGGDTLSDAIVNVLEHEPRWEAIPAGTPSAIRKLLHRCLDKNTRARLRDVGDARLEISEATEPHVSDPTAPSAVPRLQVWQRPVPATLAVLLLVLFAVFAGSTLTRPVAPRTLRFHIPLVAEQSTKIDYPILAISPDGAAVVYEANRRLWIRFVDRLEAEDLAGTEGAVGPFFSEDGQWIGFFADGQLRKVPRNGGSVITIADVSGDAAPGAWDINDQILYAQRDGILRVPGAGGTSEVLVPTNENEVFYGPQMLPAGEWVLFTVRTTVADWDTAQIVVQSLATHERRVLIDGGRDGRLLPTGHLVFTRDNVLIAAPFDVESLAVGSQVQLEDGVMDAGSSYLQRGAAHFSVSNSGSLVYLSVGDELASSLVWVGRDGTEKVITESPQNYSHPRVSPDGTRIAVDIVADDGGNIWVWNIGDQGLTQLTFGGGRFPYWTADSARVVFQVAGESPGLYWKAADGTGQVELIAADDRRSRIPFGWTQEGLLLFEGYDGPSQVGLLSMDGEANAQPLLESNREFGPALSPGGQWLSYGVNHGLGDLRLEVRPFPNVSDGPWRISLGFGRDPVWAPNGRELFYRTRTDLMVTHIETGPIFRWGTPRPLLDLADYDLQRARNYDLAPEGDRFVFVKPEREFRSGNQARFDSLIFIENWTQELLERVPVP